MKHSPVLVLGLTTLALGTASAVYAAPLNINSASPEVTSSYVATDVVSKERTSTPFDSLGTSLWETVLEPDARSNPLSGDQSLNNQSSNNQSPDKSPRYPPSARFPSTNESLNQEPEAPLNDETFDEGTFSDRGGNAGNHALSELPLFQLPPLQSSGNSPPSDPSSPESPSSSGSPSSPESSDSLDRSPFALPDQLTDAELFEQDSLSRQPVRQPDSPVDRPLENNQPDRGLGHQPANHQIGPSSNAEAPPLLTAPPHAGRNPPPESVSPAEQSSATSQLDPSVTASSSIGLNFDPPPASATRSFSAPSSSALSSSAPSVAALPPNLTPDLTPNRESNRKPESEPESEPDNESSSTSSASAGLPAEPAKPEIAEFDAADLNASLDALFARDSDSLVAIAVGSAEGTRGPDGSKNPAYHGHVDPGNGVWNLGSFSYQHGANSPEEADAKQLARLRSQAETILSKAEAKGLNLSLEERLNGIDLANQAPKAALDAQGYIDWLADAHAQGMTGSDAILWARVQSFIDPSTQTWDAPGLGNSETRITQDQERRMLAIAKAIALYLQDIANAAPFDDGTDDQAMQWSQDMPMNWSTG